jgi:hypothetical protein
MILFLLCHPRNAFRYLHGLLSYCIYNHNIRFIINRALYCQCFYRRPSRVYFVFFSNAYSVWHNPHLNAWDKTNEALQTVTWRHVYIINDEENAIPTYVLQCFNSLGRSCNYKYHLHQKFLTRQYLYCNGFDQCIAKQRLRKHVPSRDNGSCVSVDECCTSLLLGSPQRPTKLAGQR